ncbi:MAG: hypothetical protein QNJ13_12500 [Paracoccaceae bacterium]|nr:hypothetical protein [Paracoccaceae bacterium]
MNRFEPPGGWNNDRDSSDIATDDEEAEDDLPVDDGDTKPDDEEEDDLPEEDSDTEPDEDKDEDPSSDDGATKPEDVETKDHLPVENGGPILRFL